MASATIAAPALTASEPSKGRVETLPKLDPSDKSEPGVRIWLPPGYGSTTRSCPTLYMLDGQFAFASDSDGMNFAADRRIARLVAARSIRPTIIVAIDNLEDDRFLQYMPQAIYDRADRGVRQTVDRESVV